MDDSTPEKPKQDESLRTMCPFCLSEIDAHLGIKGRPYWRCWRCEGPPIRNKTALALLKADGWLWKNKRPLKAVQAWVKRMAEQAGLTKKEKS